MNSLQKELLQGTRASRPFASSLGMPVARGIRTNDEIISELEGADFEALSFTEELFSYCEGRRLSGADAAWILGFYLHHNVEGHFVPGSPGLMSTTTWVV